MCMQVKITLLLNEELQQTTLDTDQMSQHEASAQGLHCLLA